MKLYAERKQSKKGDTSYVALYVDFGYRKAILSMETAIIAELADKTMKQINELPVGSPLIIGEILIKK